MRVVDFTVWIDYFNGVENPHTDYLHAMVDITPILIGDLILAEVLQGFGDDADFGKARRALERYIQVEMVNPELALQSARNYRMLRRKGVTVRKTVDIVSSPLIASKMSTIYCIMAATMMDLKSILACGWFTYKLA